MAILIVSLNPLFGEVIAETVAESCVEVIELTPEQALSRMGELRPEVVIIDETISQPYFDLLLANARLSQKARTIVVNPAENEIMLVDIHRSKLRKADDLIRTITSYPADEPHFADGNMIGKGVEAAESLSGMIEFMAAVIEKPPDVHFVSLMRVIKVYEIPGFEQLLDLNEEIRAGVKMISDFLEETTDLPDEEIAQILIKDWGDLFQPVDAAGQRRGRETSCLPAGEDPAILLGHLAYEYAQGGMEIGDDARVGIDSLTTELDFICKLGRDAARLLEAGDLEGARSLKMKAQSFYEDHLGRWAVEYLSGIEKNARSGFFKGFLCLSKGVITRLGELDVAN